VFAETHPDEKKRRGSRMENDEESICPYCFDKYHNGTTYLFRGFIRRQNSVLGARNKFDT